MENVLHKLSETFHETFLLTILHPKAVSMIPEVEYLIPYNKKTGCDLFLNACKNTINAPSLCHLSGLGKPKVSAVVE